MQPTREHYQKQFQQILDRLNPAQREAVEQIEGPVLVIAGPGTGKTQLLSARVGNILLQTDTGPANILCLTFTEAGVLAMRNRLLSFIGPEAHRVHIYTFHSFCNSIIQNNLELFGRHGLEPLSDLERIELIRRLIDQLPVAHPLRIGKSDPYFYEGHLRDLFQRMKAEDWTVPQVEDSIDAYLSDLPHRPGYIYQINRGDFRKGDLKEAQLKAETERMERFRSAVQLFPAYLEALRRLRRYDYEDMILWVLRAFEKNEALLRTYQEQYLYLLVDEFQDTNGAQNAILQQLINYWDKPNIFIVGDDDQSIYEFQGARLKNLSEFYHRHQPDLKLILLDRNYRSTQSILDTAGGLIRENERRIAHELRDLSIQKELQAHHPEWANLEREPLLVEFSTSFEEAAGIVQQIEQLQRAGVPLGEIAVIYAKHRQAATVMELLGKKEIPYEARRKINVLDLPLIANLREILIYLHKETEQPHSAEPLLFRILHYPFLHISEQDLARLSLEQARRQKEEQRPWREMIGQEKYLEKIDLQHPASLLDFGCLVKEWLADMHSLPLIKLVERLINRSGLLSFALRHAEAGTQLAALTAFFDFLRNEILRRPRLNVAALLDILKKMDDNRLPIELQLTNPGEEAVQLLTAHSAKGLEFEYVFMIDCLQDHWEPGAKVSRYRFAMPDTLTFSGEEDALEARRRLFYVAMTRAKHSLQISYSRTDAKGKEQQRSLFLDELQATGTLRFRNQPSDPVLLAAARLLQLQEMPPVLHTRPPAEALDELLAGFALSVSALNQYLRCPLGFYYEHILKVPVAWSEAASYGAAMHHTLQRLFEFRPNELPGPERVLQLFEAEMERMQNHFAPQTYRQRLEEGKRKLIELYRQKQHRWHKKVKVELHIRNVEVAGVPLSGVIDKLELYDPQIVHIVDYKTGSLENKKLQEPDEANPHGGNYWRQLLFYKLLFEAQDKSGRIVQKGTIAYLEPDRNGIFQEKSITYQPKDVDFMRRLIRDTYARIRRHEFFEGCGEPDCQWCRFLHRRQAPDSFAEPEIEALDD